MPLYTHARFRAWHVVMRRMFSADELGSDQLTLSADGRGFVNVSGRSHRESVFYHDAMLPLQSTGLTDRVGKEIFEGDIVSAPPDKFSPARSGVIVRGSGSCLEFCLKGSGRVFTPARWHIDLAEVVGNIYEHEGMI